MNEEDKIETIQLNANIAKEVAKIAAETARVVALRADDSNKLLTQNIDFVKIELTKEIGYVGREVSAIKIMLEGNYVRKETFAPIQRVVYGLTALMLTSVVVAILALIIKK